MKKIQLYALNTKLGILTFSGKEYSFQYDHEWLEVGFPICPDMPLTNDLFLSKTFFSVFDDASPDAWGEKVLQYIELMYAKIEKDSIIQAEKAARR